MSIASPSCRTARLSALQLWAQRSDPVLHIELRRWADLLLIAPLDANTLGKMASGICDNLLVGTEAVVCLLKEAEQIGDVYPVLSRRVSYGLGTAVARCSSARQ